MPYFLATDEGQTVDVEPDDILSPELTDAERQFLRWGVIEWGGPARCTEEMAVAMGFSGVQDLFDSTDRLTEAIKHQIPLKAADWLRVLLCTEIVFASNAIGSGRVWSITSGLSDVESITLLRSIQLKLPGIGSLLVLHLELGVTVSE